MEKGRVKLVSKILIAEKFGFGANTEDLHDRELLLRHACENYL